MPTACQLRFLSFTSTTNKYLCTSRRSAQSTFSSPSIPRLCGKPASDGAARPQRMPTVYARCGCCVRHAQQQRSLHQRLTALSHPASSYLSLTPSNCRRTVLAGEMDANHRSAAEAGAPPSAAANASGDWRCKILNVFNAAS